MAQCPTCGQPIKGIHDAETLVRLMRSGKDCYKGQDGSYYLTYGGGPVSRGAIDSALSRGWIKPKWNDAPHLEYWHIR